MSLSNILLHVSTLPHPQINCYKLYIVDNPPDNRNCWVKFVIRATILSKLIEINLETVFATLF